MFHNKNKCRAATLARYAGKQNSKCQAGCGKPDCPDWRDEAVIRSPYPYRRRLQHLCGQPAGSGAGTGQYLSMRQRGVGHGKQGQYAQSAQQPNAARPRFCDAVRPCGRRKPAAFNRLMRKTARPMAWASVRAQSLALDPIGGCFCFGAIGTVLPLARRAGGFNVFP